MPATKTQRRRAGKKRGTQSRRSRRGSTRGSAAAGRSRRKRASRTSTRTSSRRTSNTQGRKRSSGSKSSRRAGSSSRGRRYGPKSQKMVETEMRHLKQGEHKNRKQAIAIGLSKARRSGAKVPPRTQSRKAA